MEWLRLEGEVKFTVGILRSMPVETAQTRTFVFLWIISVHKAVHDN